MGLSELKQPQHVGETFGKGRFRTLRIGGRVLLDRSEVENYKPLGGKDDPVSETRVR